MIGRTVGRYKIIDKLGEGGMGTVYKAEDPTLNRLVALKALSPHLSSSEEARERFMREAQATSNLNHANITTVHDLLEDQDQHFICMEYVEGKTLRDMVESGRVGLKKAVDIILQAAEAFEAAHNKGILHRDIKSANIMVTLEGKAKVMDFGLAHLEERSQLTRTGTTMGTLAYSSPEQISGRPVDRRSEIFSLGVVFYELLSGQLPYQSTSEAELVFSIINHEPEELSQVRADVTPDVEAVVQRMLEKDPAQRYQSCGELITDLDTLRRGLETSTVGITSAARLAKARYRQTTFRRVVVSALIALVVLAAIAVVPALLSQGELDPNRVVVAVFDNPTGDESLQQLCMQAASAIAGGLEDIEAITPVAWSEVTEIWNSIGMYNSGRSTADIARILSRRTDAGTLISGSVFLIDGVIEFRTDIRDMPSGDLLSAIPPVTGSLNEAQDVIDTLTDRTKAVLAVHYDPEITSDEAQAMSLPSTYESYRLYAQGRNLYFEGKRQESIDYLLKAYEIDPGFKRSLEHAAISCSQTGRIEQAFAILEDLARDREQLKPIDKVYLEWMEASGRGDLHGMLKAGQRGVEIAPMSQWTSASAIIALWVNRLDLAEELFEKRLRSIREKRRGRSWPGWTDMLRQYCETLHLLGKHRKELQEARKARESYNQLISMLDNEVRALTAFGDVVAIRQLIEHSFTLPPQPNWNPASVMRNAATGLRYHGYREAASEVLDQAARWYENRIREEGATPNLRYLLAVTYYSDERRDEARQLFKELADENPIDFQCAVYLGLLAARRGDREEAMRISEFLEDIAPPTPPSFGVLAYNQACIAAQLGDKERAVRLLQNSVSQGHRYALSMYREMDFEPLRDFPLFIDFIRLKD